MNHGSYLYRAHGATIESELELPELYPIDGVPDLFIRRGPVPAELEGSVTHGPGYQAAEGRYLLDVPAIARYLVTGGRDVQIAQAPGTTEDDVRVFLLSSVMGAVAHQRGSLVMHASAVAVDGGAVLFAGDSGAGKSTLGAAFHDRGHAVVTDDISVITSDDDGHPMVHAGYRHVRLAADALEHVGASLGARRRMNLGTLKYGVTVLGELPPTPLRIRRIFMITHRSAEAITLRTLTGHASIAAIVRGTYRRRLSAALGRRSAQFAQCAALGRRIGIVAIERPRDLDALPRLVDAVEDNLRVPQ